MLSALLSGPGRQSVPTDRGRDRAVGWPISNRSVTRCQRSCGQRSEELWSEVRGAVVSGQRSCRQRSCGQRSEELWSEIKGAVVRGQRSCGQRSEELWSEIRGAVVRGQRSCGQRSEELWSAVSGAVGRGAVVRGQRSCVQGSGVRPDCCGRNSAVAGRSSLSTSSPLTRHRRRPPHTMYCRTGELALSKPYVRIADRGGKLAELPVHRSSAPPRPDNASGSRLQVAEYHIPLVAGH